MPPTARPLPISPYLTVAEVAPFMRVSKMTVYRIIHSGELPSIRVGKSFRVHQDVLAEYLKEQEDASEGVA